MGTEVCNTDEDEKKKHQKIQKNDLPAYATFLLPLELLPEEKYEFGIRIGEEQ